MHFGVVPRERWSASKELTYKIACGALLQKYIEEVEPKGVASNSLSRARFSVKSLQQRNPRAAGYKYIGAALHSMCVCVY